MKILPVLSLGLAILAGSTNLAHAQPNTIPLVVSVEVENVSRDRTDNSSSETKRLKITIENRNKEAVTGKLNWKLLGRDVQSRDLKAVGSDVTDVSLAAGESKVIEGSPVVFAQKEGKTTKKGGKKGGSKTAPDTGVDYKGYFVEVNDETNVVIGSAYSPGMKENAKDLFIRPASQPGGKKKK